MAWRLIERNPAASARLPRASSPEMRPLRPAEARRFLAAAEDHPLQALFVLAVTTGMRQGELLALRWRDIDWSGRRIAVGHTLVRMDGRWWLGDPKTASSQRAIDLTAPTIDVLRAHRARSAERLLAVGHALSEDDLVFCDDAGQPLWGRHITTGQLRPLLCDAGLPPIRFHDLRHTFATLQLAAGTNPKIVSEVLGHTEVAITLDRYSHALPTLQAKAMARLDTVLGRAPRRVARDTNALEYGESGPDKGPDKGPNRRAAGTKRPDLSSDRADEGEFGTAYRIPAETSHASQPRSRSTTKRRMRHMRHDR